VFPVIDDTAWGEEHEIDKITDVGEPASELERPIADLWESRPLVFVFGDGFCHRHTWARSSNASSNTDVLDRTDADRLEHFGTDQPKHRTTSDGYATDRAGLLIRGLQESATGAGTADQELLCKPICKPDTARQRETGETEPTEREGVSPIRRGRRGCERRPETSKTRVVWLITQRSRVQIPPRYQGQRPFLEQRKGLCDSDVVVNRAVKHGSARPGCETGETG
jgi:hypothetical protein